MKPEARQSSVRELAVRILADWSKGRKFAQDLLDETCRTRGLAPSDAGLLHSIVLAALRNLTLLDHWTDQLTGCRHLDHHTRWILRIGLVQLLMLELPPHAAVNETVKLAGKARSLVNAVLRRADRERETLLHQRESLPLATRTSHPDFLIQRWTEAFGEGGAVRLCEWNQTPAPAFIRVNLLHPDAPAWLAREQGLVDVGHGFHRCETLPRAALEQGLCYAQDPSTGIAPLMLGAQPGETILDACAAPGGKTSLIATMMRNEGRLIAADSAAPRLARLRANLDRLLVKNAQVFHHDLASDAPAPWGGVRFDRILLDVPCSNTGVMRRRVDVRWRIRPGEFSTLATAQTRLLLAAIRHLRPGGTLVYSTCSIDAVENRGVIQAALEQAPSLRLQEERLVFPPDEQMDGAYAARLMADAG